MPQHVPNGHKQQTTATWKLVPIRTKDKCNFLQQKEPQIDSSDSHILSGLQINHNLILLEHEPSSISEVIKGLKTL